MGLKYFSSLHTASTSHMNFEPKALKHSSSLHLTATSHKNSRPQALQLSSLSCQLQQELSSLKNSSSLDASSHMNFNGDYSPPHNSEVRSHFKNI